MLVRIEQRRIFSAKEFVRGIFDWRIETLFVALLGFYFFSDPLASYTTVYFFKGTLAGVGALAVTWASWKNELIELKDALKPKNHTGQSQVIETSDHIN